MRVERVINSIRDGVFLYTFKIWVNTRPWYRDKVYDYIKKESKDIIAEGVKPLDGKKSDVIWILWLQGYEKAPKLVKACINSVKVHFPDKEVIVLSEQNINQYVHFPKYIEKKYKKKRIPAAQYSDLVRLYLLTEYGGLWIDATVLCTGAEFYDQVKSPSLFVYRAPETDRNYAIIASNWFLASDSQEPILRLTQKILWRYWEKHNVLIHYFIFHMAFKMATERYADEWDKVPEYITTPPFTMGGQLNNDFSQERWDELVKNSCFHKLTHHVTYEKNENNFYNYIINRYG